MGGAIAVLIFVVVVYSITKAGGIGGPSTARYDRLLATGIPARGILLAVSRVGTKTGTLSRRFELRDVVIDVEIPGQPPYEVSATPVIPINFVRDVLPGSTVELRLDPNNPSRMAIIGPGTGFVPTAIRTA